jgi:peptide deformylase
VSGVQFPPYPLLSDHVFTAPALSLLKIARLGHPILRRPAAPVEDPEFSSPDIQRLIDDMIETMRDGEGVGIAAPQVYAAKRIFIVEVKGPNPRYPGQPEVPLTVFVNPQIIEHSEETEEDWEGCLSIPDLRGRVPRWRALRMSAKDREGKTITLDAGRFFARVIQHELDHLDGVVFLDRMRDFASLTHLREYQKFWSVVPSPAPNKPTEPRD